MNFSMATASMAEEEVLLWPGATSSRGWPKRESRGFLIVCVFLVVLGVVEVWLFHKFKRL